MSNLLTTTIETIRTGNFPSAVAAMLMGNALTEVGFADAVIALAAAENEADRKLSMDDAEALLKRRREYDSATTVKPSSDLFTDTFGAIKVGGTEVTIAAFLGAMEQQIGAKPGESLIERLDAHLAKFTDAATDTVTITSLGQKYTRGKLAGQPITSENRLFNGMAVGSTVSAADKNVARLKKLAAIVRASRPAVTEAVTA
jgi:hypothetical protein